MDTMTAQVVLGALAAYVLQWLKRASWFPLLTENSTKAWKVLLSGIVAAATALSINFDWASATGTLTISGLTWPHIWNGLIAFGLSFLSQHTSYELLVRPSESVPSKLSAGTLAEIVKKSIGPAVALALILPMLGCAQSTKAKLQQADRSLVGVLQTLDSTEQALFKDGSVTPAFHKQFSGYMVTALTAGKTFHQSVLAYKPGQQPVPVDVVMLTSAMRSAADLVRSLPASDKRDKIAAVIDTVAFVAQQILAIVLPPSQAAALMPYPLLAGGH